jgi:hypothetical protein
MRRFPAQLIADVSPTRESSMADSRRFRVHTFGIAIFGFCIPLWLHADSDLEITCGASFIAFDKFVPEGRALNVVPLEETGDLRVAGTVLMPFDQPHRWAIYDDYIIVRTWNDIYIYEIDMAFQPQLIASFQIDDARPNVGGTTAIALDGSLLRAYGTQRTIAVDLSECTQECQATEVPFDRDPPDSLPQRACTAATERYVFTEVVASS